MTDDHKEHIDQLEKENFELKIQIKHLNNEIKLLKEEYEDRTDQYFDMYSSVESQLHQQMEKSEEISDGEKTGMLLRVIRQGTKELSHAFVKVKDIVKQIDMDNIATVQLSQAEGLCNSLNSMLPTGDDYLPDVTGTALMDFLLNNQLLSTALGSNEIALEHSGESRLTVALHPERFLHTILSLVDLMASLKSNDARKISIRVDDVDLQSPLVGYDSIRKGEYLMIAIILRGFILEPVQKTRLFEPWYCRQIAPALCGLELTNLWFMVQELNGYIHVDSSKKGTALCMYFPTTKNP
jgi:hypothetical protein